MACLETLDVENCDLDDEFCASLAEGASSSQVHRRWTSMLASRDFQLKNLALHSVNTLSRNASRDLATSLMSMAYVTKLDLFNCVLNDAFCLSLAKGASSSQLKNLVLYGVKTLSRNASRDLATSLTSMKYLDILRLSDSVLKDAFYSSLAKLASSSRLKNLTLHGVKTLTRNASRDLATSLTSMACLETLDLSYNDLDDAFCSSLAKGASSSQLKGLTLSGVKTVSRYASHDLATSLTSMMYLETFHLSYSNLDDAFYCTLAKGASSSQIKGLTLSGVKILSRIASRDLATSLTSMTKLETLQVHSCDLDEAFCSSLVKGASSSQLKKLKLYGVKAVSRNASRDLAIILTSLTHLETLELDIGDLDDAFYSILAKDASSSQLKNLTIRGVKALSRNATRDLATNFTSVGDLKIFDLFREVFDDALYLSLAEGAFSSQAVSDRVSDSNRPNIWKSLVKLETNYSTLCQLLNCGFPLLCPDRVKELQVRMKEESVPNDIIERSCQFVKLQELTISSDYWNTRRLQDATVFCHSLGKSGKHLVSLTFKYIHLGNTDATQILQTARRHGYLKHVTMVKCWTDKSLDPLVEEINIEGKLTVEIEHGMWT